MTKQAILSPRRYKFEWALLGAALLILATSISYWLSKEHADIDSRERDRLQSQAKGIDENLGHQLKGMNDALTGVLNEFSISDIKKTPQDATRHLKALSGAMPGVRSMFVLDAGGGLLAATWENYMPGQNFSHREYYTTPHEQPDPATLYVSTPFTTIAGTYSLNVSRVATGPNGEFSGVVTATLEPDYFEVVLRSVLYAPDMEAFIAHADGRVFVVMPENADMLGKNLSMPGSNFSQYQERGQTAAMMTGIVYATGEQRLRAFRTVKPAELKIDKPLVIAVGRNISAVFASWRIEAFINAGFYGLFALFASMSLYISQKRRKADYITQDQARQALRESEARFQSLTRLSSDFYWETDVEHRIKQRTESNSGTRASVFCQESPVGQRRWEIPYLSPNESGWQVHRSALDAHLPIRNFVFSRLSVDGSHRYVSINGDPVFDEAGNFDGYRGVGVDITERMQMEERVRQMAFYDALTNLPNRRLLNDRLSQAMAASKRSGCHGALMFLDLDNFKSLNDTQGHEVGDLLLIEAADRLKACVREIDTVARFGGDEFVVLIGELDVDRSVSRAQAGVIAEKLRTALAKSYVLEIVHGSEAKATVEHHCTASIGVVLFIEHEASQDDILKWADAAMYEAKKAGRDLIRFYASKTAVAAKPAGADGRSA